MRREKMDCSTFRDRIDEYIEGKTGESGRIFFEQHLKSCSECAQLVRLHELSERVIMHEKSLSPGHFLTERVMARIENAGAEKEAALIRILRPAAAVVSVAAAIFAGVMIGNISRGPSVHQAPIELTLMNDTELESLDVLSMD